MLSRFPNSLLKEKRSASDAGVKRRLWLLRRLRTRPRFRCNCRREHGYGSAFSSGEIGMHLLTAGSNPLSVGIVLHGPNAEDRQYQEWGQGSIVAWFGRSDFVPLTASPPYIRILPWGGVSQHLRMPWAIRIWQPHAGEVELQEPSDDELISTISSVRKVQRDESQSTPRS